MTNKQYNTLLDRLAKANAKYHSLLKEAEEEFKNRYGYYPSEIDFDFWIDTYCVGNGFITAEEIEEVWVDNGYREKYLR
jgi:hypothetical protein